MPEINNNLERFDISLPSSVIDIITEIGIEHAIRPRTMARMLLVEKVREIEKVRTPEAAPTNPGCAGASPIMQEIEREDQHDR